MKLSNVATVQDKLDALQTLMVQGPHEARQGALRMIEVMPDDQLLIFLYNLNNYPTDKRLVEYVTKDDGDLNEIRVQLVIEEFEANENNEDEILV